MQWIKKLGALAAGVLTIGAGSTAAAAGDVPQNPYEGLRSMALNTSATRLGLDLPKAPTTAYGVIIDMGVGHGTATLVAFSTGDASLYLSTGGGVIGGGQHPSVKRSAIDLIQSVQTSLASFSSTTEFDVPPSGKVRFYILTNKGILTAIESEDQINSGTLPLSPVWHAGQKLLTEIRMASDKPRR